MYTKYTLISPIETGQGTISSINLKFKKTVGLLEIASDMEKARKIEFKNSDGALSKDNDEDFETVQGNIAVKYFPKIIAFLSQNKSITANLIKTEMSLEDVTALGNLISENKLLDFGDKEDEEENGKKPEGVSVEKISST